MFCKMSSRTELSGSRDFAAPLRLRLLKLGSYYKIDPSKKIPVKFYANNKKSNWFHSLSFEKVNFQNDFFKAREPKSRLPDNSDREIDCRNRLIN